ncbi:MAG: electron transport complex subunit RsxE [Pseudomonadota bacterium]
MIDPQAREPDAGQTLAANAEAGGPDVQQGTPPPAVDGVEGFPTSNWAQGLWFQNPVLVMLLGLCPLLAVSTTVVSATVLGIATLVTLTLSNVTISAVRAWIPGDLRLPVFVAVVATAVTLVDMTLMSIAYELHREVGLFIPLIVTNCTVLARAEAFAARNPVADAFRDGWSMGAGFAAAIIALGTLREVLGHGSIGRDVELLLGPAAAGWSWQIGEPGTALLLAILPPGAFFGLALLALGSNWMRQRTGS